MILDNSELQLHNPWWESKHLILEDKKLQELSNLRFKYYHPLIKSFPLNQDAVLTLRGPRRIGKTTLLKLIIKNLLLNVQFAKEQLFFYPCDLVRDYQELYQTLKEYLDATRATSSGRRYIFLDEVSFVPEWQRAIKSLSDSNLTQNATFLITGSNIIDLQVSSERLPGRRGEIFSPDINFYPLSFKDFILLIDPKLSTEINHVSTRNLAKITAVFKNYLITGGFPQIINEFQEFGFIKAASYEAITGWVAGDLHKAGKSTAIAIEIIKNIEKHQSNPVSYYQLAKESGVSSHATVQEYLETLERMFIIITCPYYSLDQKRTDVKKNKKIYFADPFIRCSLLSEARGFLSEAFDYSQKVIYSTKNLPAVWEEAAVYHLKREGDSLYYGKYQKHEIDFVSFKKDKMRLFEVKYQNTVKVEPYWYGLPQLTVLTKSDLSLHGEITQIPLPHFLAS